MSEYGLRINNRKGIETLSISDTITRLVYTRFVLSGESGSVSLPGIEGFRVGCGSISTGTTQNNCNHEVSVVGNIVSWNPPSSFSGIYSSNSLIFVFLYS